MTGWGRKARRSPDEGKREWDKFLLHEGSDHCVANPTLRGTPVIRRRRCELREKRGTQETRTRRLLGRLKGWRRPVISVVRGDANKDQIRFKITPDEDLSGRSLVPPPGTQIIGVGGFTNDN